MTVDAPGPGIYENVEFDEYLAWPYVSNSSLVIAERSMLHFRNRLGDIEPTDSMRLGSLIHCGKLEPLKLMERYIVMPDFAANIRKPDGGEYANPRATAAYRETVAEFKKMHADKTIVTAIEYDRLIGVVKALSNHERARRYLDGSGPVEVSIVWDDSETGVRCKARIDKLNLTEGVIADLKSTDNAGDFQWSMKKFRYHRQSAMYVDGMAALTQRELPFVFVVVENKPPHLVRAAPVRAREITLGRASYRALLMQIAECQQSGVWPGYPDPEEWTLPGYDDEWTPSVDETGQIASW